MVILIATAAVAAQPSPEAVRLGRQVAESGLLATVLPAMQLKETNELVEAHPELGANERIALLATSQEVYEASREQVMQAEALSYARRMSIGDLRTVVAFHQSAAGKRYRDSVSDVIEDVMPVMAKIDFKGEVSAKFCKATGKLCAK